MFAALLPGFREARTPVAVGALTIAAIWVAIRGAFEEVVAPPLWKQIVEVLTAIGIPGQIAVGGFVSYLLGIAISTLSAKAPHPFRSQRSFLANAIRKKLALMPGNVALSDFFAALPEIGLEEKNRQSEADRQIEIQDAVESIEAGDVTTPDEAEISLTWGWIETKGASSLDHKVRQELILGEQSLKVRNPSLYDELDRNRAEGEFRVGVALPLALLIAVTAARLAGEFGSHWWLGLLALLALPVAIWIAGARKLSEADAVLDNALANNQASTPTLDILSDFASRKSQ